MYYIQKQIALSSVTHNTVVQFPVLSVFVYCDVLYKYKTYIC